MYPAFIVEELTARLKSKRCDSLPFDDGPGRCGKCLLDHVVDPSLDPLSPAERSVILRALWLGYRPPCESELARLANKALRQQLVEAAASRTCAPRLRTAAGVDHPVHEHDVSLAPAPTSDVSLADETSCSPTHSAPRARANGQRARTAGQPRPRSAPRVPTKEPARPSRRRERRQHLPTESSPPSQPAPARS
jgi:hypothetical protein